jgi:NCAIR mutase (PurE)-related protein
MDASSLRALIEQVASGDVTPDDAVRRLRRLPYADLGFARVDHHRDLRQGMPEAVYGPGKTPEHCAAVVEELLRASDGPVLVTRASDAQVKAVEAVAAALGHGTGQTTDSGSFTTLVFRPAPARGGVVVIVTAGTADIPVATECRAVLGALGFEPALLTDCGVAGLHRLLAEVDAIAMADAVVVVAGMDGALPSVVGGLTPAPVVAVPTSTGYGAAFEGVTALLTMLSSCASGVTVVGIDNGYGAACAVARLLP